MKPGDQVVIDQLYIFRLAELQGKEWFGYFERPRLGWRKVLFGPNSISIDNHVHQINEIEVIHPNWERITPNTVFEPGRLLHRIYYQDDKQRNAIAYYIKATPEGNHQVNSSTYGDLVDYRLVWDGNRLNMYLHKEGEVSVIPMSFLEISWI